MSRPKARIIELLTYDDVQIELLEVKGVWALTYKDQMFNHRTLEQTMLGQVGHYGKTFYSNEGNARAQSRNLNRKFKCEYFAVKQIYGE